MKCVNVEIIAGKSGHPRAVALCFVRDNRLTAGRAPARARPAGHTIKMPRKPERRELISDPGRRSVHSIDTRSRLLEARGLGGRVEPGTREPVCGSLRKMERQKNLAFERALRYAGAYFDRAPLCRHAHPFAVTNTARMGAHAPEDSGTRYFSKVTSRPSLLTGPKPAVAHDSVPSTQARYRCLSDNR